MRKATPTVVRYRGSETSPWVIEGLRVDGKRVRRFFPTQQAAKVSLRKILARQRKEGEGAAIHMPEQLRVEAVACAERLRAHGATLKQATDHYLTHLAAIQKSCTVSAFISTFHANKKADGASDRYRKDLRNRLERFEISFGGRVLADIQPGEIEDWLRDLGLAAQSRLNYRTVLKTFFGAAVEARFAQTNPVVRKKIKIVQGDVGVFTPNQMRTVLEKAPQDFVPYLVIGAFAGLRAAEIERLDWAQIDLGRKLIEVKGTTSKSGQKRFVVVTDNLVAWLAPHSKKAGPVINPERAIVARRKTSKDAKIAWPHNVLRHSYGSYHLGHHKNAAATAAEMGHSSTKMVFKHYREVVQPELAAQWWQIAPPADYANVIAFRA